MASGDHDNPTVHPFWTWLSGVLERLVEPHFVIAIVIVFGWICAVRMSLSTIVVFNEQLATGNAAFVAEAKNTIPQLRESAVIISGLFTTVLALVLGYYFGQQGETNRTSTERESKKKAIASYSSRDEVNNARLEEAKEMLADVDIFLAGED